jgi:hypothetical protein
MSGQTDDAVAVLRELIAGADDYRCWYIPSEIRERAEAVLAAPGPTAGVDDLAQATRRGEDGAMSDDPTCGEPCGLLPDQSIAHCVGPPGHLYYRGNHWHSPWEHDFQRVTAEGPVTVAVEVTS